MQSTGLEGRDSQAARQPILTNFKLGLLFRYQLAQDVIDPNLKKKAIVIHADMICLLYHINLMSRWVPLPVYDTRLPVWLCFILQLK